MRELVMPEDLVKKKRIQAGHRGVVTRRVAEAERLLGGDSRTGIKTHHNA